MTAAPDTDQAYVDTLTDQLTTRRPDLLDIAENELQKLRGCMQTLARFIHNEAIPLDIRQDLARDCRLPIPEK